MNKQRPILSDVTISLGRFFVTLRPTLRAAATLHERWGGFAPLLKAVSQGNHSAICDLIRVSAISDASGVLNTIEYEALHFSLHALAEPLARFVLSLAGVDEGKENRKEGEPITFDEFHHRLFEIATGWLGWSPDQAWDATPGEILAAQRGRLELLKAIFGGKGDSEETIDATPGKVDPVARAKLNALGDLSTTRMP